MNVLSRLGIVSTRQELLIEQNNRCAICDIELSKDEAVLDHDHSTLAVRGVLHRGCNRLLGYIENSRRLGVPDYFAFSDGVGDYLVHHYINRTGLIRRNTK